MTAKTQGPSQSATERRQPSRRATSGQAPTAGPRAAAPLSFVASIPLLQSAFTYDGEGAARFKLDVSAMYTDQLDRLRREYIGKAFRVTIEADPGGPTGRERQDYR